MSNFKIIHIQCTNPRGHDNSLCGINDPDHCNYFSDRGQLEIPKSQLYLYVTDGTYCQSCLNELKDVRSNQTVKELRRYK